MRRPRHNIIKNVGVLRVIKLPIKRQDWDLNVPLEDLNQHEASQQAVRDWRPPTDRDSLRGLKHTKEFQIETSSRRTEELLK
jgi:hypothetical protein